MRAKYASLSLGDNYPDPHRYGEAEIRGETHNARIQEYLAGCRLPNEPDETPWCSAFVNWCLVQAGVKGTNSAAAISFVNDYNAAQCLEKPSYGCIVVLKRNDPNNEDAAHVAFYTGSQHGKFILLGGNQRNRVCARAYANRNVLGYVLPAGFRPS